MSPCNGTRQLPLIQVPCRLLGRSGTDAKGSAGVDVRSHFLLANVGDHPVAAKKLWCKFAADRRLGVSRPGSLGFRIRFVFPVVHLFPLVVSEYSIHVFMTRPPMLPSGMNTPWAGSDRYKDFGAQYHSQPDGRARSVHPCVLSVYASTLDFGGVSGEHSLCRPDTNAATLDTEPLAKSHSGGIYPRLSTNHFQFARPSLGSSGFGGGLVLVLSIAVLVLDRSLRYTRGSLNQSSQHRHNSFPVRLTTTIRLTINRVADSQHIMNRGTFQGRSASDFEESIVPREAIGHEPAG